MELPSPNLEYWMSDIAKPVKGPQSQLLALMPKPLDE